MLYKMNLNYDVYIQPNEFSWKVITNYLRELYKDISESELIAKVMEFRKRRVRTIMIEGKETEVLSFPLWEFMNMFGPYMEWGAGPACENNSVYITSSNMYEVKENVEEKKD